MSFFKNLGKGGGSFLADEANKFLDKVHVPAIKTDNVVGINSDTKKTLFILGGVVVFLILFGKKVRSILHI